MLKYNYTNFTSSSMATKIIKAMQEALDTGHCAFILNRKGERFMRVDIVKHCVGVYSYQFIGSTGQNLGSTILRAMFDWAPEQDQAFTRLTVKLHSRTEHPLITLAKNAQKLQSALLLGCKETFTMLGNLKRVGVIKRNWLGRRVLYLFTESSGVFKLVKQTPEVLAAITYREPLAA